MAPLGASAASWRSLFLGAIHRGTPFHCHTRVGDFVQALNARWDAINDGTRASFAKFSQSFHKIFKVFVASETCWDLFGPAWMHSDTFGYVRKRSEAFGRSRNFWIFQYFSCLCQILVKPLAKCIAPRRRKSPKCALSSHLVVCPLLLLLLLSLIHI